MGFPDGTTHSLVIMVVFGVISHPRSLSWAVCVVVSERVPDEGDQSLPPDKDPRHPLTLHANNPPRLGCFYRNFRAFLLSFAHFVTSRSNNPPATPIPPMNTPHSIHNPGSLIFSRSMASI